MTSPAPAASGFLADYDAMFYASAQFLDTQKYLYSIAAGIVGDLAKTAGMAGDDTAAHNFAKVYEPAAKLAVKGIGQSGETMATIASRLLGMATAYLELEDSIAKMFTGAINTLSPTQMMKKKLCDPEESYQQMVMVTGSKEVHELPLIGHLWPQGNPDELRVAARVWAKAAELVDDAQVNATKQQRLVTDNSSGAAVDAFVAFGAKIYSGSPSHGAASNGKVVMEDLSAACRRLSEVCNNYADHIDHTRTRMLEIAAVIVAVTAAGIGLTVFTLGGSDAAAAAADAAAVADAVAAAEALALAAEADAAAAALAAEIPVIEAELAELATSGAVAANTNAAVGTMAAAAGVAITAGALLTPSTAEAASPAILPPLPPIGPENPPAYPIYDPATQAANAQWAGGLNSRDPVPTDPGDLAYQVKVAGQPERQVVGADGTTKVWADGYRPADGALIDAKHVRELDCSPRTLENLQQGTKPWLVPGDSDEIRRYGVAIANPNNKAQFLEIDTNDPSTQGYWQFLAARNHVPSRVRVEQ